MNPVKRFPSKPLLAALLLATLLLSACQRPETTNPASLSSQAQSPIGSVQKDGQQDPDWCLPNTRQAIDTTFTPTPNPPRVLPTLRATDESYTVQPGDGLAAIAGRYGLPLESLIAANNLANPNLLEIGQVLLIPAPRPANPGTGFKIIPDSELVNGPAAACFDLETFIIKYNGYLSRYTEQVDGRSMTGAEIISRVAAEYSVNPRLLLALLEYQSAWLTASTPNLDTLSYPLGNKDFWREGLYRQLAWAADQMNRGYYLWQINGLSTWVTADGAVVPINNTINPGTAAVQRLFSLLLDESAWRVAVDETGFIQTWQNLFGSPFGLAIEPLVPANLRQPAMQLPFEKGSTWSFTGGPHGGWGDGSAWAALDFAPPGNAEGCVLSDAWVVAAADGLVVYADNGIVIQDLDGDGSFQTGWSLFYGHIESRGRVRTGTALKAGDRIGHPSCEGGVSSGTHVHLARRYNGEWIAADGSLPFIMDGWVSRGTGTVYNGILQKDGRSIEAWDERKPENQIHR